MTYESIHTGEVIDDGVTAITESNWGTNTPPIVALADIALVSGVYLFSDTDPDTPVPLIGIVTVKRYNIDQFDQTVQFAGSPEVYKRHYNVTFSEWEAISGSGSSLTYVDVAVDTLAEVNFGYFVDTTAVVQITLPVADDNTAVFVADRTGLATTNPVTIVTQVGDTIMGATSFVLRAPFQGVEFVKLGNRWNFVGVLGESTTAPSPPVVGGAIQYEVVTSSKETSSYGGYICDSTSVPITMILHDAIDNDRVDITDGAGNAFINNITIIPQSGDTVMGGASFVLNANFQALALVKIGTDWKFLSTIGEQASPPSSNIHSLVVELDAQLQLQGINLDIPALLSVIN